MLPIPSNFRIFGWTLLTLFLMLFLSTTSHIHAALAATPTSTCQTFDHPTLGTPYTTANHVALGKLPTLLDGGPNNQGKFLRLAYASPVPNQNSLTFSRSASGAFDQIAIDFDFRLKPGTGRADGFGLALLNTSQYGISGAIAPQAPLYAGEEPNYASSLGIGFDIHQATARGEISNNHLSVHFNNQLIQEINPPATLDFASGDWIHARLLLRPGGGHSDVTVQLTPKGKATVTIIDKLKVTGFLPYEARLSVAGRSGGESADHDLDNIYVQFLNAGQTPLPSSDSCGSGTENTFDTPGIGTPYSLGVHIDQPMHQATLVTGGPTRTGQFLRLAHGVSPLSHTSIAFNRSDPGAYDLVVADFDFRITPATGRADGFGFALLNTAIYSTSGVVNPLAVAEEPNFAGSLGVGLDIYQSTAAPAESNNNHISIHFGGNLLREFDVSPFFDLASGEWMHARIVMRPGGGFSDVSVILSQCGRPAQTVVNQLKVDGFTPYEARPYWAARAGGLLADHDLDNVRVSFLGLNQTIAAFTTGCASALETSGNITVTVTRSGALSAGTVYYHTANLSATAGLDYTQISGTLSFASGESSKTLTVPLLDDTLDEGDENFLISLSDPTGAMVVGGPTVIGVTIIDDETARRIGHWSEAIPSQVVAVHAHLLPTGKVLYWDRHDHTKQWDGRPRLWDPVTGEITLAATLDYDIFCGGHVFLEDGRLLVTGGHITGTTGDDEASLYNPFDNTWLRLPKMNDGRWYPSNVLLADNSVLVVGGTHATGINTLPQVWEKTGRWRDLTTARQGQFPNYADYYPFLYLAPNGKVFDAGPQQMARYLDPTGTGQWSDVAASTLTYRDYGSSVQYGDGKFLIVGGNPREPDNNAPPTITPSASAEVIDLNAASPIWRAVTPMHFGRRQHNATLLPDGTVLVTGGSRLPGFDEPAGAVNQAEVWHPTSEQWTLLAAHRHYRGYHSVALLLPDGRVLVGGGGHPDTAAGAQVNFEIFSPPYLFKGVRPIITSAPTQVTYSQTFALQSAEAADIATVNWVRLSSVTHSFNQNQRINRLAFVKMAGGLTITAPSNPNLAPPGHYMLFILNSQGVPSLARVIQLKGSEPRINHAPEAKADTFTLQVGASLTLSVLTNDSDLDNDSLLITAVSTPQSGIIFNTGTTLVYTATQNVASTDVVSYTISDSTLQSSALVTITITSIAEPLPHRVYLPIVITIVNPLNSG